MRVASQGNKIVPVTACYRMYKGPLIENTVLLRYFSCISICRFKLPLTLSVYNNFIVDYFLHKPSNYETLLSPPWSYNL